MDQLYYGQDRNYELFEILAGVKSRGFDPIVAPRGFPPEWRQQPGFEEWQREACAGGATWLTVKELLNFSWHEKKIKRRGYVTAEQFGKFQAEGRVEHFTAPAQEECQSPDYADEFWRKFESEYVVISRKEMKRLIQSGGDTDSKVALVADEIPYAEFAGAFVTETLPRLQKLGEPAAFRLVIFFCS